MDYVGPFTFQWVRSFIGAAALLPVMFFMSFTKKKKGTYVKSTPAERKNLLLGGVCCGFALCIASCFQQVGIQYTSVGNAGFITSMYMVLVPILSIVLHKKVKKKIWFCVMVGMVGMYFLSISEGFSISKGDAMVAACALFFAVQIMLVDYFAPKTDGVQLSFMQFVVSGILSMLLTLMFETPDLQDILRAAAPILYAGVLSSGVAYTLQIIGQKYAEPVIATLLMSLESVFSMLGGIVVLQQIPTGREVFGCCLVFFAVVVSQVNIKR